MKALSGLADMHEALLAKRRRPIIVKTADLAQPSAISETIAKAFDILQHGNLNAHRRGLLMISLGNLADRADRRYLPNSVPVVKRVAALAGDLVCANCGIVVINDHVAAETLLIDDEGRPLPAWNGCRTLGYGEFFLLMEDVPASFDGRYFRPVPVTSVIGRLVPLWTW